MHTTNLWSNAGHKTELGIPWSQLCESFSEVFYNWIWEIEG